MIACAKVEWTGGTWFVSDFSNGILEVVIEAVGAAVRVGEGVI